jgi:hypothetical protein
MVCSHARSFLKNKVFTTESHQAGLLERKPGGTRDAWQVSSVKALGPVMKDYIDLLKAGHRSVRSELKKILALSTIYGADSVHTACEALLASSIIGVDALEMALKCAHHPKGDHVFNPAPINFINEKLNRIVPAVDLRRYDALLFEHENESAPVTDEGKDDGNNDDEPK